MARITALVGALGFATFASACGSAHAATAAPPTQLKVVVHPTDLDFVTHAGTSPNFPTAPLAVGDHVVGRDSIMQAGLRAGTDYEVCTISFDLHALCDDTLVIDGKGDLHATWILQWPQSGATGPNSFDGIIDGGTAGYRNVTGDFHAVALVGRDIQITAILKP
jgi:hypothetical protein